jgi:protocatechuate 3,4-dioxygenase beta subunit
VPRTFPPLIAENLYVRFSGVIAVCAILVAGRAFGQDSGWVTPATGTAVISGRVVGAADGRALARASVTLETNSNPRHVVADEHGAFEFVDLPAGRYQLRAALSGYLTFALGQLSPADPPAVITLEHGQVLSNLEIALPTGGVIEVRVVDEAGTPIEGAFVQAQRPRPGKDGELSLAPTIANKQRDFGSDDRGILRLYDLEPGTYYVSATPPVVLGQRNDAARRTATGGLQTFHPGVVTLADAAPVELAVGEERHIDLVIAKPYAAVPRPVNGAITVHVTDDSGNPRAGVEVRALEVEGEGAGRKMFRARTTAISSPQFWEMKDFYTDDHGDARIYGLPMGDYVIAADPALGSVVDRERSDRMLTYVPVYFPGSPSRADAHALSIRPWDDVNVELALRPVRAAHISGRVIRWDGEPGRTFVVLSRNSAGPLYPQGLIGDAMYRAELVDGQFTFYNIEPGDYIIRTSYDVNSGERDGTAEVAVALEDEDISDLILTTVRQR